MNDFLQEEFQAQDRSSRRGANNQRKRPELNRERKLHLLWSFLGGFPVKQIKSKNLFTDRYRSELNYLSESKLNAAKVNRVHSLQQIFSFSEEEAQEFLHGFPVKDAEPGQNHV